jgi:hypothetical protein
MIVNASTQTYTGITETHNTVDEYIANADDHRPTTVANETYVIDTFSSTPEIEHYNNYSKAGVLFISIDAEQTSQSETTSVTEAYSLVENFNLNSIPESWSTWHMDSLSPDWSKVPHKGMTALSKDEIKELMHDLTDEFNNSTSKLEKQKIGNQVRTLQTWYISHGSPEDRKAVFERAMKTIRRHAGENIDKFDYNHTDRKTLLDYLMKRDAYSYGSGKGSENGMKLEKPYPMDGGGTVTAVSVVGMMEGIRFEVNYQGHKVMDITTGSKPSVHFEGTALEAELQNEINAFWFRAIGHRDFL